MLATNIVLNGKSRKQLDTEIKYTVAAARADGFEVVRLDIDAPKDSPDARRLSVCTQQVLRTMKREGRVQFFIPFSELEGDSTEAEYLKNKYSDSILALSGIGEYLLKL